MMIEIYPFCGNEPEHEEEVEMQLIEIINQEESGNNARMFSQHKYKCVVCDQQVTLRVFA